MRFLEYLFFKYYYWQVKVGNGDIPSFMALISIVFSLFLYCLDIVSAYSFFICPTSPLKLGKYSFVIISAILFGILYLLLVNNGKDKRILETHKDEWQGKKRWGAVLFPLLGFLIMVIEIVCKILMNRGTI